MGETMGEFVLLVDFECKEGTADEVLRLVAENARKSVENEAGCRQFDVTRVQSEPNRIVLYEVYDDEAAFKSHSTQPHVQEFLAKARPMLGKTTMTRLDRAHHPRKR
jgi:(4S)-4-hydroxy-5-phosphonooxypentane-2,3-dione isomerase